MLSIHTGRVKEKGRRDQPPTSAASRRRIFPSPRYRAPAESPPEPISVQILAADERSRRGPSDSSPATSRARQNISSNSAIPDLLKGLTHSTPFVLTWTRCPPQRQSRGPCMTRSSMTTSSTSRKMVPACSISVCRMLVAAQSFSLIFE